MGIGEGMPTTGMYILFARVFWLFVRSFIFKCCVIDFCCTYNVYLLHVKLNYAAWKILKSAVGLLMVIRRSV